ncbi:MAG: hypothetical protein ACI936_000040 [Paraglaciecola sp.]
MLFDEFHCSRATLSGALSALCDDGFKLSNEQTPTGSHMKVFNTMMNVGKVKYVINYHDGVKAHRDGSEFFDTTTFSSMKKRNEFIKELKGLGYKEQSMRFDGKANKPLYDNSIKVDVPYMYEAIIVKPRCSKPSLVSIKDLVTVEIKDVAKSDMPLAIKVGEKNIHWHDNKLWSPLKSRDGEIVTQPVLIENASKHDNSYQQAHSPFKQFWGNYYSECIGQRHSIKREYGNCDYSDESNKDLANTPYRNMIEDNQKLIIEKAKAIAASIVSVEGVIYSLDNEPYYNTTAFGCGRNMSVGFFISTTDREDTKKTFSERFNFNALSYEAALKYARDKASTIGYTSHDITEPNCGNVIEVLMPEAITLV